MSKLIAIMIFSIPFLCAQTFGGETAPCPFQLKVEPKSLQARLGKPVLLNFTLTNISKRKTLFLNSFRLVPGGSGDGLKCLRIDLTPLVPHSGEKWTRPPGKPAIYMYAEEDTPVRPEASIKASVDLTDYMYLPTGSYNARFFYYTGEVGEWIPPNRHAWHGKTNSVDVRINIIS